MPFSAMVLGLRLATERFKELATRRTPKPCAGFASFGIAYIMGQPAEFGLAILLETYELTTQLLEVRGPPASWRLD